MTDGIASTPEPPYWAVIFTSRRTAIQRGYDEMAERMVGLVGKQPGFLGFESVHEGGVGITVSYWTDRESIRNWKEQPQHVVAQQTGKRVWYEDYALRVARVERVSGK